MSARDERLEAFHGARDSACPVPAQHRCGRPDVSNISALEMYLRCCCRRRKQAEVKDLLSMLSNPD